MALLLHPDFLQLEDLLTPDERRLRDSVRDWVERRFLPLVVQHHRDGTFPLELAPELGELGVFGPTISGEGGEGLGNVAAGLMMQELERGDSGTAHLRVCAGLARDDGDPSLRLGEQKARWLPALRQGHEARLVCADGA
jgi:alkylation response protein AidB-like acyl-CoA dehydrogenase